METLRSDDIQEYIEKHIADFHHKRLESLDSLRLSSVLKRKNPYLYRAKAMLTSEQIVRSIVDAHLSSNEETIFGDWLEGLAVFINTKVYGGFKSGIRGIDLEFDKDGIRYIVAIKSGPNWGNSSQVAKMVLDFKPAIRTLRTANSGIIVQAVNGCCYGKDSKPDKGVYFKYCGQKFWFFISGSETLFTDIVRPLGYKAREKNEAFMESYVKMINRFTHEFSSLFCKQDGSIDWESLVKYNSATD